MTVPASGKKRPWYHPMEMLQRIVIYPLIIYVVVCVYLYCEQNILTYPSQAAGAALPIDLARRFAKAEGLIPWDHPTPGASSPQGYVSIHFADPAPRGTIVVFHGNGDWAAGLTSYVEAFHRRGFRTFLYEYPGYGGRLGRPSETNIVPDARALVRSLDSEGFGPIYIWGESLGSGVASAVCADQTLPVHGLALVTPWDNIANVGLSMYPWIPVRQLMIDRYDSIGNLAHFSHPICVIRSANDEVIPPPLSINLYAHLPEPKKIIVQQGCGHNDWPRSPELAWWDDALNFIAPVSGQTR